MPTQVNNSDISKGSIEESINLPQNDPNSLLEKSLYPVLTKGLTALCKEKPANPIEWLGQWLLENNPNKPRVIEPEEENEE